MACIKKKKSRGKEYQVDGKKAITALLPEYYEMVIHEDHNIPKGRILFGIPNEKVYREIENIIKQTKIKSV